MNFNSNSDTLSPIDNIDSIRFIKSCESYQPEFLFKIKSSEDFCEKCNFVIFKLGSLYKKYNEPYNLGYQSVNQPILDLSKLYKFRFFRPTINSDFSESTNQSTLLLRGGDLPELLGILTFIWFINWFDSIQGTHAFQPITPPNHEILGSQSKPQYPGVSGSSQSGFYIQKNDSKMKLASSGQNSPDYRTTMTTFDGKPFDAVNKSLDHLVVKHGHTFNIDDPLPMDPNQQDNGYEDSRIRTRLTPENRNQFRDNVEEFGKNSNLMPFYDVEIRNGNGDVYYCPQTGRCIATRNDPVTGERILIKAQPLSAKALQILQTQNKLYD